jgi:c-di-GMP-binding flagellar brake protein YcgR
MGFLDTRPAPIGDGHGDDPYAAFRSDHPREVLALLRSLRDGNTPVTLSGPGGAALGATVWTIDPDRGRMAFDIEANDPQLSALVEGDEVNAVAYLDSVKLQFDLQDLMLVHSPRATALQARLPRQVYRFQRRGAYRVRTPERSTPAAHFRHPAMPEMRLALRVVDVSIGGCALLLPADVPPLPLGTLVQGVMFELDGDTRFEAGLQLQHVTALGASNGAVRLGCELKGLGASAERTLQRYIDQTQKRRRLLSLD